MLSPLTLLFSCVIDKLVVFHECLIALSTQSRSNDARILGNNRASEPPNIPFKPRVPNTWSILLMQSWSLCGTRGRYHRKSRSKHWPHCTSYLYFSKDVHIIVPPALCSIIWRIWQALPSSFAPTKPAPPVLKSAHPNIHWQDLLCHLVWVASCFAS